METIKLRGYGPQSRFIGAEIIQATTERDLDILAVFREPKRRAAGHGIWAQETAWRTAVIRRARSIVRGNPHTVWVQWDPGRDNAETELL